MAYYAFLDENNYVVSVIPGVDENNLIDGLDPETYYGNYKNMKCVRTSYNNNIRKQYAGVGYFYDEQNDVFISPKPFVSWILDSNFDWQAPKPKPEGDYFWNEEAQNWEAYVSPES